MTACRRLAEGRRQSRCGWRCGPQVRQRTWPPGGVPSAGSARHLAAIVGNVGGALGRRGGRGLPSPPRMSAAETEALLRSLDGVLACQFRPAGAVLLVEPGADSVTVQAAAVRLLPGRQVVVLVPPVRVSAPVAVPVVRRRALVLAGAAAALSASVAAAATLGSGWTSEQALQPSWPPAVPSTLPTAAAPSTSGAPSIGTVGATSLAPVAPVDPGNEASPPLGEPVPRLYVEAGSSGESSAVLVSWRAPQGRSSVAG